MEVIGEAILSAAVESLFRVLTSQEFLKFATQQQVDKELKKWESKLSLIQGVLNDAEEKQATNQAVKIWLTKLRDLAYDAEDILDEFHTEALQSKLKSAKSQASTSVVHKLLPTCCTALRPSDIRRNKEMATKLQEITKRLEEIVNEKKDLDLGTTTGERSKKVNERVATTSLVKEPKVYGREKDKEAIVELLMCGVASNYPYSVIPIIGMGGLGKTTLAQLIYNDETLAFDSKAWVCVSDDFDILKITKTVLQHWESCEANNLNILQEKLKKILHGKKFLIVLDDVWNENYDLWTTLRSPFAVGAAGSIIIMTTRSKVVSSQMGSVPGYELKLLSDDDCMSLLAQHALGVENFDANPYFKGIGEEIVLNCKGLPLAAKTLGGLLRGKQSINEWEVILNSKIWDLHQDQSNILPALRISYHYLPSHLKRCFAFCAIFPKDYEFDEYELVLLWMAEGFLQQPKKGMHAEDLGHVYFNDLLSRSFFQQSSGRNSLYVMHDLISDLALFVSEGICFGLDDKPTSDAGSYNSVRHSSFTAHEYDLWQRFEFFYELKGLRTFIALQDPKIYGAFLSKKVVDDLIPKLKCLRSLSLAGYSSLELPDSIGTLKHLRYLNLSHSGIEKLPQSVTALFNLQTLLLCGCRWLVELPIDIGNLINLQYLDISGTYCLRMMPLQISQLINLRSLSEFIVGEQGSGPGIGELRKLCHLQGRLLVTRLQNVSNVGDAKLAILKEKLGLRELALEWKWDFDDSPNQGDDQLQVLLSLQPNSNLEKLSVTSYGGIVFPSWLADFSFNKIVELRLHNCRKATSLPSIVKLPKLRHLSIGGMDEVKEMVIEALPALETLIIKDMPGWEQWSWAYDPNADAVEEFPKLCKLELKNCPKFVGKLPSSLPYLKELTVEGCQALVLENMTDLASLTTLKISGISGLASLHGTLVPTLVAIEYLYISCCEDLKHLWEGGNDHLNKLAKLKLIEINQCEQLASLVEGEEGFLPSNLQELRVNGCYDLKELPNGLHGLTSLRSLDIWRCPKLLSFPKKAGGLPYSLKHLSIDACDSLESLPHGMMSGPNSYQCLLEELWIENCPSLRSFPEGKLPTTLQHFEIRNCENLDSLPVGIMYSDPQEVMSSSCLESLYITGLLLTSFPAGKFPPSLETLDITRVKIQSLPSSHSLTHLTELNIYDCDELESFPIGRLPLPNLMTLCVWNCQKLRSLSDFIDNLTSLRRLTINLCSSLLSFTDRGLPPTLTSLSIARCENLRQSMSEWGLCTLTSLQHLDIDFKSPFYTTEGMDYFPDYGGLLLPASLTSLTIFSHKNLKFISRGIQHLTSLERFLIHDCPKLQVLPRDGFPATLGYLSIDNCPLLEQRCKKENEDYWPIIAHIPDVRISN